MEVEQGHVEGCVHSGWGGVPSSNWQNMNLFNNIIGQKISKH